MAVPKRKMSKARRDRRRANWKLEAPGYVACPQCHEPKMPHHVCTEWHRCCCKHRCNARADK